MLRKSILILSLSLSLVAALIAIALQEDLRDRMGDAYWIVGLAITGCVLLVLSGYVWDRTVIKRVRTLRDSTTPQLDDDDDDSASRDPDEIIGLARKIERMARSLQNVEASYRAIVEDQIDLICRYRTDGRLTFINGAYSRAFGRRRNELVGTPFPFFEENMAASRSSTLLEREIQLPDASRAWIQWTHRAIKDSFGEINEYQAVGHDVTSQRQAELELVRAKQAAEAADKAKSEFLAIVSHEIRTPINGVIGFSRMLSETPLTTTQREHVNMINSSGMALEKLIEDILDLSKIEAGKVDIEHVAFSPRSCAEEVCAFFADQARSAGLVLDFRLDPGVPAFVNGDHNRVRQILINLMGNALKFTERGQITLQLSCSRGESAEPGALRSTRLFFAVSDTGVGIPAEKLPSLFQPFAQVGNTSRRSRDGTGLGLLISKRLCELMGGTISVESTVGEGSTFRFSVLSDYIVEGPPMLATPPLPSPARA